MEDVLVLTIPTTGKDSAQRRLALAAERLIERHDPSQPLLIDSLATELGVSKRTLFHAFRCAFGMGPYSYFQLIRLHQLRGRLSKAETGSASVTDIATSLGYTQLGRLSGHYRTQFGELPRQTLERLPQSGARPPVVPL